MGDLKDGSTRPDLDDIVTHVASGQYDKARSVANRVAELAGQQPSRMFGRVKAPRLSIIVVVSGAAGQTIPLLDALIEPTRSEEVEVCLLASGARELLNLAKARLDSFRYTDLGRNTGPSIARNLGAKQALGDVVLFLDDDGYCTARDMHTLAAVVFEYGAIAVRGRICPKTATGQIPPHYDLFGDTYTAPSTEGFSAWNKRTFLELGGFDEAMFGHEGLELTHRALKTCPIEAFRYCDEACFFHDFADDLDRTVKKNKRHAAMDDYMKSLGTSVEDILRIFDPSRA